MDERPVGFFDSGLGGVSVLGEALRELPNENFVYFGDTLHIPYGDKPPDVVLGYAQSAAEKLIRLGCKALVIACNTATSVAAEQLRKQLSLPIIGMEPALKPASLLPGDGRVLVLATRVTLALPKFKNLMERFGQDAVAVPCPGLMELVENGELEGPHVDKLLDQLLKPWQNEPVKAVVLGCTHYPFLKKAIAAHFDPQVALVDGGLGTVRQLGRRLAEEGLCASGPGGQVTFLSSQEGRAPLERMQHMLELWRSAT